MCDHIVQRAALLRHVTHFIAIGSHHCRTLPFADSLAALLARLAKPEPTLPGTAFILAQAGYVEEAWRCTQLCREIDTDGRLLDCLIRKGFGARQYTLLMAAVACGHGARASRLLDMGADANAKDADDWTALHWACDKINEPLIRLLLDHGADVDARTVNDCTPLLFICNNRSRPLDDVALRRMAELLIDSGALVEAGHSRHKPMPYACRERHEMLACMLVDRGADPNAKGLDEWPVLHTACHLGFERLVRSLLSRGVDVNARGSSHRTALHWACDAGYETIARLLLDNGASVSARDVLGDTPHRLATSRQYRDSRAIAQLLVERGAEVPALF